MLVIQVLANSIWLLNIFNVRENNFEKSVLIELKLTEFVLKLQVRSIGVFFEFM